MRHTSLNFAQVLNHLRDGKGYVFGSENHQGQFYKAPYPAEASHSDRDEAHSAITFWHEGKRAMPTLMLYDFDEDCEDWFVQEADSPWPV